MFVCTSKPYTDFTSEHSGKCQNMTHFKTEESLVIFLWGAEKDIADHIYMILRECIRCLVSSFLFYLPCCNSYTQFSLFIYDFMRHKERFMKIVRRCVMSVNNDRRECFVLWKTCINIATQPGNSLITFYEELSL